MPVIRAQVVLPFISNKPEDVAVNTFHFDAGSFDSAGLEIIRADLVEFYNTAPPNGPSGNALSPLAAWLSNSVSRVANAARIKVYDLSTPAPRVVTEFQWTLGPSLSGTAKELPAQVAVVGSFYGTRNLPRQRGRLFFGPFTEQVLEDDAAGQRSRPALLVRECVHGAMKRLAAKLTGPEWCVYSRAGGGIHPVTAGWVDDKWDTQRRRIPDAVTRTVFP